MTKLYFDAKLFKQQIIAAVTSDAAQFIAFMASVFIAAGAFVGFVFLCIAIGEWAEWWSLLLFPLMIITIFFLIVALLSFRRKTSHENV